MRARLPHQLPYRPDIDGLRAFAILSVIAFHIRPDRAPGGFVGVDVFFVISGFLISSLILESAQQGRFSFAEFYSRRIRRILPALAIVLAAVFAAGWLRLLPHSFVDLGKMILASVFFVPNFQLWTESGYFAGNPNLRPLLHLWSLGVEEQFYLVWPVIVLLFWRKGLGWVMGVLAGASFAGAVYFYNRDPSAIFFFPVTRLWELLGGAFLAWRERRHVQSSLGTATDFPPWVRHLLSALGLGLLLASVLRLNSTMPFPGWWALPPVIGTMLTIAAGSQAWLNRHVLAHRVAVFIGLISYPLYLWHWPILAFLRMRNVVELSHATKYGAVLAAAVLAWLTYVIVEKPIRSWKSPVSRGRAVIGLLAAMGVLALFGGAVILNNGVPARYPAEIRPFLSFDYSDTDSWGGDCFLQFSQPPSAWKPQACIPAQTTPPEPLVVLWGDSHAAHLRHGLVVLQRSRRFRLAQMTATGCAPFMDVDIADRPFCRAENDTFLREIQAFKPDVVILGAYWYKVGIEPIRRTLAVLKKLGIGRVVVMGPPPNWQDYLPDLLIDSAMRNGFKVASSLGPEKRVQVPEAALRALATEEGAVYISEVQALCPAGQCVTMTKYGPQYVTFLDESHYRNPGSELLMERVSNQIFGGLDIGRR